LNFFRSAKKERLEKTKKIAVDFASTAFLFALRFSFGNFVLNLFCLFFACFFSKSCFWRVSIGFCLPIDVALKRQNQSFATAAFCGEEIFREYFCDKAKISGNCQSEAECALCGL